MRKYCIWGLYFKTSVAIVVAVLLEVIEFAKMDIFLSPVS